MAAAVPSPNWREGLNRRAGQVQARAGKVPVAHPPELAGDCSHPWWAARPACQTAPAAALPDQDSDGVCQGFYPSLMLDPCDPNYPPSLPLPRPTRREAPPGECPIPDRPLSSTSAQQPAPLPLARVPPRTSWGSAKHSLVSWPLRRRHGCSSVMRSEETLDAPAPSWAGSTCSGAVLLSAHSPPLPRVGYSV